MVRLVTFPLVKKRHDAVSFPLSCDRKVTGQEAGNMSRTVTKVVTSVWQDEGVGARVRRSVGRREVELALSFRASRTTAVWSLSLFR